MPSQANSLSLSDILKIHLDTDGSGYSNNDNTTNELEIRFGTRGRNKITRIDYDNVIKKLKSLGFNATNSSGNSYLKIQTEFTDPKTGRTKMSNLRTTVTGLTAIQKYCKENKLTNISDIEKDYMLKMYAVTGASDGSRPIYPINKDNYNMRISYQAETELIDSSNMVMSMLDSWDDTKKTFRYINRLTFRKTGIPLKIELSIVKNSNTDSRRRYIPEYNIQDSGVFDNPPNYEIEIELVNDLVGTNSAYNTTSAIESTIKYGIKSVLSGLQESNYPIDYDEQDNIKLEYAKLFKGQSYSGRVYNRDFIGPSSYTLQMQNIQPINDDSITPNIRNNYTVTDKADGTRKLLYIAQNGKLYLINTNMSVQYTGCRLKTANEYAGTLIDGEHILHDKGGNFINLYAAFDIYYIKGESVREKSFVPTEADVIETNYRLPLLIRLMSSLDLKGHGDVIPLKLEHKRFYMAGETSSIFDGCKGILDKVADGLFKYNTDGLIFTPAAFGVGGSKPGQASDTKKVTWEHSFKWKPPEYNTIDFLFKTRKGDNNEDEIKHMFKDGLDTGGTDSDGISQYKIGELYVGFDTKKHGYINPCGDVIQDNLPSSSDVDNNDTYKPMKFYPTNPVDKMAHLCRINLTTDTNGSKIMKTIEQQMFEDDTIVEFSYNTNETDPMMRWQPLRVRYDKTAEFKAGRTEFGNAYHVANSNWKSIHDPITREMISTGENIPNEIVDDDVYYNRVTKTTATRALRDFHNLVVKKKLITSVSSRGNTLIDFAVGKGGDFSKWIASKLSFVFGVDISKDNIENKLDGACARYLNYRTQYKSMPYALFVSGDSSRNIKDCTAIDSDRDKLTTKAIFGETAKDERRLGKGVHRQYGKGSQGFNISSCQFALHYFFKDRNSCTGFLTNVAECTKLGGYFIGACYDGGLIFNDLRNKAQGEKMIIMQDDVKIWEVTKDYSRDQFVADETSLGYTINVYQETINKTIAEYLVNFEYLVRLMENFGFVVLPKEEAREVGLKEGIGSFSELYKNMERDMKYKPHMATDIGTSLHMSNGEKQISFYNKYFIFKKVRTVDAKQVAQSITGISSFAMDQSQTENKASEVTENTAVEDASATVEDASATVDDASATVDDASATVDEPSATVEDASAKVEEASAKVEEPSATVKGATATTESRQGTRKRRPKKLGSKFRILTPKQNSLS